MGSGQGSQKNREVLRSATADRHKWSLINGEFDESDTTPDKYAEYNRSVREFLVELLGQFRARGPESPVGSLSSGVSAGFSDSDSDGSASPSDTAWGSWRVADSDEYIAHFAQPYPAQPMWAALPRSRPLGGVDMTALFTPWPSDYNCAPLVCVVLRDAHEHQSLIRSTIAGFACHPAGLLVSVRAVSDPDLRFVLVGLRPQPRCQAAGLSTMAPLISAGPEETAVTRAVQRQIVWAAVHEVMSDLYVQDKALEDVYMLRSVFLYDRLFKWLARTKTFSGPLRMLSQNELDLIVHEFGEETATHFLFVNNYLKHLRVAAMVSLVCLLITFLDSLGWLGDQGSMENIKRVLLVLFLPAWGFHFLASWRSIASRAGFRWLGSLGSVQNSVKEVAREQAMESAAEQSSRYLRVLALSFPLLFLEVMVVFAVTVTFVCFEVYIYDVAWEQMTSFIRLVAFLVYNLAFGLAFVIVLGLFHGISKRVTTWERHPDKDLFEWHLTAKIYANWFLLIFLYFFVIAFCYIPFGDNIAEGIAAMYVDPTAPLHADAEAAARLLAEGRPRYSIRGALQSFRPSLRRLAIDVALFFVLQDGVRLMQVLIPVARAAYGLYRMQGVQQKRHRHKRRAIVNALVGMFRFRKGALQRDLAAASKAAPAPETVLMLQALASTESRISVVKQPGVSILFCQFQEVRVERGEPPTSPSAFQFGTGDRPPPPGDIVQLSCALHLPGTRCGPTVFSHLRVCDAKHTWSALEENPEDFISDVLTLTLHPRVLSAQAQAAATSTRTSTARSSQAVSVDLTGSGSDSEAEDDTDTRSDSTDGDDNLSRSDTAAAMGLCDCSPGAPAQSRTSGAFLSRGHLGYVSDLRAVKLRLRAELVDSVDSDTGMWELHVDVPLNTGDVTRGEAQLGPVHARYVIGLVHGATHCEALRKVPLAVRAAGGSLGANGAEPQAHRAAAAELDAWQNGHFPWLWSDEELASRYWEEVFELFAVKESFETFELYAHLTTQFSYVCLFGIAVPVCPLLAWLFTSIEMRQDQLRLLWLSRPPHPHQETMKFKRTVSVDAWYTIIRFTCYMSVIVNLLLWGLTYSGLSSRKPSEWSQCEWWRAIAIFLFCQQACFVLGSLLHRGFSKLDHETASAYLRRCSRLQHSVLRAEDDDASPGTTRRQADRYANRRRLTRSPSRGLSSLV